ncbi:MAG: protein kinase [Deltaproteobacteria bacterium]|nr:protein kinase [Deltaproteobacteria bacterium]
MSKQQRRGGNGDSSPPADDDGPAHLTELPVVQLRPAPDPGRPASPPEPPRPVAAPPDEQRPVAERSEFDEEPTGERLAITEPMPVVVPDLVVADAGADAARDGEAPPARHDSSPEDEFDRQATDIRSKRLLPELMPTPPIVDPPASSGASGGTLRGQAAPDDARPPPSGAFASVSGASMRPIAEIVSDYLVKELARAASLPPVAEGRASAGGERAAAAPAQLPRSDDVVGGRYQIEEALGEGGMGKVLRVRHLQLDKSFALKLIQMGMSISQKAREAFYQEARLASSLQHPNIVSIVDYGEDERLGAFMVMELLEGESLTLHRHSKGRLALKPVCDIVLQVAEALHYIHGRQIIHCDIKPDNIFVCRLPSTERRKWVIKLLDFGLARIGAASARTTQSLEGTPAYMSPERIKGLAPQPSMDIYSLGVLAYELLTGRLPFDGNIYEIMAAHCNQAPPPMQEFLPERLDERADALIMKMLAKDPAARHKDMAAFLYELRTLMDMIGCGRRRAAPTPRPRVAEGNERRDHGARDGYELAPVPMCGLDENGVIVVANRAFATFLTGSGNGVVEGRRIAETELVAIYPELVATLKKVRSERRKTSVVLSLRRSDDSYVRMVLWLTPGTEEGDCCHLTIHGLDAPE